MLPQQLCKTRAHSQAGPVLHQALEIGRHKSFDFENHGEKKKVIATIKDKITNTLEDLGGITRSHMLLKAKPKTTALCWSRQGGKRGGYKQHEDEICFGQMGTVAGLRESRPLIREVGMPCSRATQPRCKACIPFSLHDVRAVAAVGRLGAYDCAAQSRGTREVGASRAKPVLGKVCDGLQLREESERASLSFVQALWMLLQHVGL